MCLSHDLSLCETTFVLRSVSNGSEPTPSRHTLTLGQLSIPENTDQCDLCLLKHEIIQIKMIIGRHRQLALTWTAAVLLDAGPLRRLAPQRELLPTSGE